MSNLSTLLVCLAGFLLVSLHPVTSQLVGKQENSRITLDSDSLNSTNAETLSYSETHVRAAHANSRILIPRRAKSDRRRYGRVPGEEDGNSTTNSRRNRTGRRYNRLCFERDGSLRWDWIIRLLFIPLFTVIGLIGNAISFLVWNRPEYRGKSYTYFLRCLAVFDSCTLIITCVSLFDEYSTCINRSRLMTNHTEASCQFTAILINVIYLMSSWMVACFTVDRYIAVCHPFKKSRLCTARSSIIAIISLGVFALISQLYTVVFMGTREIIRNISKQDNQTIRMSICEVKKPIVYDPFNDTYQVYDYTPAIIHSGLEFFWFSFTLRFFVPFVVIAVCNGYIIATLRRMRYDPVLRAGEGRPSANMAIYTLFLVCIVFVITLLPHACLSIVWFIVFTPKLNSGSKVRLGMYFWAKQVSAPFSIILLCNYTFNFVLYGLTGTQFRKAALSVIKCRKSSPADNSGTAMYLLQKNKRKSSTSQGTKSTHIGHSVV